MLDAKGMAVFLIKFPMFFFLRFDVTQINLFCFLSESVWTITSFAQLTCSSVFRTGTIAGETLVTILDPGIQNQIRCMIYKYWLFSLIYFFTPPSLIYLFNILNFNLIVNSMISNFSMVRFHADNIPKLHFPSGCPH